MKSIHLAHLIVALGLIASCNAGKDRTGYEIPPLTDMMRPVPYEAYSANPVFKNGQTMQTPVPGAVARGSIIESQGGKNPFVANAQNMARGKHVFRNYCMVCHGVFGEGDGPLIPKFPNPPSLTSARIKGFSDQDIFNVITHGKGNMPSHAGQIEPADRWKAVLYIKNEMQKE